VTQRQAARDHVIYELRRQVNEDLMERGSDGLAMIATLVFLALAAMVIGALGLLSTMRPGGYQPNHAPRNPLPPRGGSALSPPPSAERRGYQPTHGPPNPRPAAGSGSGVSPAPASEGICCCRHCGHCHHSALVLEALEEL
jgi:hypothetical protein